MRLAKKIALGSLFCGLASASVAHATPVTILNGNFELQTGTGQNNSTPVDWTNVSGGTGFFGTFGDATTTYGTDGYSSQTVAQTTELTTNGHLNYVAFVQDGGTPTSSHSITNPLSTNFQGSYTYTATVLIGDSFEPDSTSPVQSISLLSGTTVLATSPLTASPGAYSATTITAVYTTGANSTVDPSVGTPIIVELTAGAGHGQSQIFDNVALDASPAPEPASLGLLALGGLGLLARRRRA